jgi:hypothetical protein
MFQNVLKFVLMFSWVGVIPSGVPPSSDRRIWLEKDQIGKQSATIPVQ